MSVLYSMKLVAIAENKNRKARPMNTSYQLPHYNIVSARYTHAITIPQNESRHFGVLEENGMMYIVVAC